MNCKTFSKFCDLIEEHEALVAEHLILQRIRDSHFHDFEGVTKSLGAWGGDFALAASDNGGILRERIFPVKRI